MGETYETDIIIWSEQMAEGLRRLQRGEQVNDLDWDHIVEEVLAVGRNELHAVESFLLRAFEHMLKVVGWPGAQDAPHWLAEIGSFLTQARQRYAPSMAQRINLAEIYADALRNIRPERYYGLAAAPLPCVCSLTLEDLLNAQTDAEDLVARLQRR
jgi:hypothetical protein